MTVTIDAIDVATAHVPFATPFSHAAKKRTRSDSVLVSIAAGKIVGWGEGAPRPYVTGETVNSVLAALRQADVGAIGDAISGDSFQAAVRAIRDLHLSAALAGKGPAPCSPGPVGSVGCVIGVSARVFGPDGEFCGRGKTWPGCWPGSDRLARGWWPRTLVGAESRLNSAAVSCRFEPGYIRIWM